MSEYSGKRGFSSTQQSPMIIYSEDSNHDMPVTILNAQDAGDKGDVEVLGSLDMDEGQGDIIGVRERLMLTLHIKADVPPSKKVKSMAPLTSPVSGEKRFVTPPIALE
ncbi:hypothetical protein GH714_020723 [Hevea brasiliensis]|uniref:Uncharacterized protein n=1 Tax=Hevea brasiliensis TaxID=3981 RepID=A0A6A6L333_HEVBR|nr:hypothetical protein GH714_020723 [Hevea brasiliensis]